MKQKLNEDNKLDEQMGGWRSSITSGRMQLELFYWVSGWLPGWLPCIHSIRDAHGRVSLTLIVFGWWVGLGFVVILCWRRTCSYCCFMFWPQREVPRHTHPLAPQLPLHRSYTQGT